MRLVCKHSHSVRFVIGSSPSTSDAGNVSHFWQHILNTEENWNSWKNEGCPSFVKERYSNLKLKLSYKRGDHYFHFLFIYFIFDWYIELSFFYNKWMWCVSPKLTHHIHLLCVSFGLSCQMTFGPTCFLFNRTVDDKPKRPSRKRQAPEDFLGKGPDRKIFMGKYVI